VSPGIRAMVFSSFAFAVMSALVKTLGATLPSVEIALFRGLVTLIVSYVALRRAGISPLEHANRWLAIRGLIGFGGLQCYFFAVTSLPLAVATVIHFMNPLFVALAAPWVLGERVGRRELLGVGLGLVGVVCVTQPTELWSGTSTLAPMGLALGLLGAVFAASAYLVVRKLRDEDPRLVVFQLPALSVPLSLPLVWPVWRTPSWSELAILIVMGLFTQLGQLKMTEGLRQESAARATAASYAQIGFSFALGMLFFGEQPSAVTWLGAGLVTLGTWVVARTK
jgi:drug/metabolite transporter (DMT)-like permease